jgi:hypothetical protein
LSDINFLQTFNGCLRSPTTLTAMQKPAVRVGGAMEENEDSRRVDRRMRTLKGGRIVYNGGYAAADCTVKNLSEGGALLEMAQATGIPSEFVLYINPDRDGRPCSVVWRNGNRIGVAFTGPSIVHHQPEGPKRPGKRRDEGY